MKKILWGVVGLVVVLMVAVLVVPGFINWNDYKDEISSRVMAATGRAVTIGGDISLTLLPAPALVAEDVRVANLEGAAGAEMISLKSLEVRIALGPLLGGEVQVETVRLIEPVIRLEVLADGRRNWDLAAGAQDADPSASGPSPSDPSASGLGLAVRLDSFIIKDGTLIYRDAKSGIEEKIEGINAEIAADSLAGPFESKGRLIARGFAIAYDISLGRIIEGRTLPLTLSVGLEDDDARITVSGALVNLKTKPGFKGKVVGKGGNLAGLIGGITGASSLPGFLAQAFQVEGAVTGQTIGTESGTDITTQFSGQITGLALSLGKTKVTGDLALEVGEKITARGSLRTSGINLDEWLAMAPAVGPEKDKDKDKDKKQQGGAEGKSTAATAKSTSRKKQQPTFTLPHTVAGSLDVVADTLVYRGEVIREARASVQVSNGEITISQVTAQLPGGTDVAMFGFVTAAKGEPRFEGEVEVSTGNARAVLGWLGVAFPDVPADRFRRVAVKARVTATPKQVQVTGLNARFDSSTVTGGITIALRRRLAFGATVILDRINVDAYLPKPPGKKDGKKAGAAAPGKKKSAKEAGAQPSTAQPSTTQPSTTNPLAALQVLNTFDANLKVQVKSFTYRGTPMGDLVFDGTLHKGNLVMRRLSVGKLAGGSVSVKGTVRQLTGDLSVKDLDIDARFADTQPLFRLAGMAPPVNPKDLGAVAVKGRVSGSVARLRADLTLKAAGATVKIEGTLKSLGGIAAAENLNIDVRIPDTAPIFRLLGQAPAIEPSKLGKVSLTGQIDGSLLKSNIDLNLKAAGAELNMAGVLTVLGTFAGTVRVRHADLSGLLRTLEVDYRPAGKLGGLDVAATVKASPTNVSIAGLKGVVGPVSVAGTVDVEMKEPRPMIRADLQTGAIVIDQFLPARRQASLDRGVPASWRAAYWRQEKSPVGLIAAVFTAPPPPPLPPARPGVIAVLSPRWSPAPLDLSPLGAFDGALTLKTPSLSYGRHTVENVDLAASLVAGVLTAERLTGTIHGGRLTANFRLDGGGGTGAVPRLDAAVRLENMDVTRAARAIGDTGAASGRMGTNVKLSAVGRSVAQLVSSLAGSGDFALLGLDVKSGAKGTALAGALNLISSLNVLGGGMQPGKLANVTGSFVIERGIARSNDLRMDSGYGTAAATGVFDLPNWRMQVKGQVNLSGGLHSALASRIREIPQALPLHIEGPMDDPKVIEPNPKTILGRQIIIPGVQKLIEKKLLKGKDPTGGLLQQLLPGLLGQPQPPPAAPPPQIQPETGGLLAPPPPTGAQTQEQQQQPLKPEDLLKQLFKIN